MIPLTPWVKRLIFVNAAVFMLSYVAPQVYLSGRLVPAAVLVRPWTVLSYMFLHASLGHLFFNMLGLFFFGPRLEERLGGANFLRLYLWGGLGGALFSFVFAPQFSVVGASAAVYAVLMGFAMFWPRERIYIYFVLPVEAWLLVVAFVVISFVLGFGGAGGPTAHLAHLGGLVSGFAFLRLRHWKRGAARRKFQHKVQDTSSQTVSDRTAIQRWESIDTALLHELNRQEVETLLRKVRGEGVRALTHDERAFLDRMTTRH